VGRVVDAFSHPERVFQVWSYTVGMGRLLLRSTKTPTFGTRIDVLLQNVTLISIPTLLEGLSVRAPDVGELPEIRDSAGAIAENETRVFIFEGASYSGYVVAGVMVIHEDEGEYHEPSELIV
jgi:hypothetical protein